MKFRLGLFGVLVYSVALAVLAPASVLAWLATSQSAGRLAFAEVSGSLWAGRAGSLLVTVDAGKTLRLDDVRWRIEPQRLLLGGAPMRFSNTAGDLVASLGIDPVSQELTDLQLRARLETLSPFLGSELTQGLTGEIRLQSPRIRPAGDRRGKLDGEVLVDAGRLPSGTYSLGLIGEGRRFAIRWSGPRGPRPMSGSGWWDDRLHLDGLPGG
jgi:hypothetical protein